MMALFPEDSAERKAYPVYSGCVQYFPSALAAIARHSFVSNEKHNPGQPLHHDRAKSGDEADALLRHLMEGDYVGMAWRALALLQKHLESEGAPVAPGARNVMAGVIADPATPVAHHATDAPMPPHDSEAARALIDLHESDDTPEESLNFQRPNPLGEDAE